MNQLVATPVQLRAEHAGDHAAIYDLTKRAFAPMPYSGGDEQDLIDALRHAGALEISLVAEQDDTLVGHIAFSPAFTEEGAGGWFALGPVSVEPQLQKTGIGSALIKQGLAVLQDRNAKGCVLVGNPDYYGRFGFEPAPESCPEGEPAEYYQMLPMKADRTDYVVGSHKLFHAELN